MVWYILGVVVVPLCVWIGVAVLMVRACVPNWVWCPYTLSIGMYWGGLMCVGSFYGAYIVLGMDRPSFLDYVAAWGGIFLLGVAVFGLLWTRGRWLVAWLVYGLGGRYYSFLDDEWHPRWEWQERWIGAPRQ